MSITNNSESQIGPICILRNMINILLSSRNMLIIFLKVQLNFSDSAELSFYTTSKDNTY